MPTPQPDRHPTATVNVVGMVGALLYALLLAYGTLFPLQGWETPLANPFELMLQQGLGKASRADILTNIFVYIPLGFLLAKALERLIGCRICLFFLVLSLGALLSLLLEYLQAHIPHRVPSVADLLLNTTGTATGAVIALALKGETRTGRQLARLHRLYIEPGPAANLGLAALGLWILSQLGPLVPSLDMDNLRRGIKPLVKTLQNPVAMNWPELIEYAAAVTALALLFISIQRIRYRAGSRFLWLLVSVLLLKILIVGRQLTLEAATGAALGALLAIFLSRHRRNVSPATMAFFLIVYLVVENIQSGVLGSTYSAVAVSRFNWIPFRSHMTNNVSGILDIIGGLWPFIALAYAAIRMDLGNRLQRRVAVGGALVVFLGVFGLEWYQQYLPKRSADITDALLATLAWLASWWYVTRDREAARTGPRARARSDHSPFNHRSAIVSLAIVASLTAGLAWYGTANRAGKDWPDSGQNLLPPPEELPPLRLPDFRYAHPRLPAPTPREILRIRQNNPGFIRKLLKRAKQGEGPLHQVILAEHLQPGSQNLALLFKRLMELEPSWRGHSQAKPLALAYDWLNDRWSETQRAQLAAKAVEASRYIIWRIREKQKLSPYNVYLYNSPLQALMASSIATYGDLPEAELPMRWTTDYWINHVLPVWRQIMGRNGGWHEGGEYVGIGIGQAIYQLPAMWRKATGQDLFAAEPGIRGFADFLVYRTRPDRTHMRWGDGGHFNKDSPDRVALALETRHRPAYSLYCPKPDTPSSWPWGPLGSNEFCDPEAVRELPLQKHFDGLGMVIARSDWSPDATYLTFKAGDNFWSHSHLDQGAFTLFKGRALAIDSGFYAGYGSDHHLNYSYQSVAHNVVTVTDPQDKVPKPPKKKQTEPRTIANDGGQRRIGSGWGEPAPLDLAEWLDKGDTYRAASIEKYYDKDDLVVAVADVTPAYTNSKSGKGTFAHRTFRVRKYWRTLIYDRRNDLVIVHDDVVSANPAFRKRSLIHTMAEPVVTGQHLTLDVPAPSKPKTAMEQTGHMEVHVLFPQDARIDLVGGKGREFFVDGRNYDPGGKFWKAISRRKRDPAEGGRWRVEISPPTENERDQFLMVLVPGSRDLPPLIRPVREASGTGARITGEKRSLEVIFPHDREGVIIRILDEAEPEPRPIDLTLPLAPGLEPEKSIWQRIEEALWSP